MSNRMYYFGVSLLIGSFLFVVQAQAAELSVLGASTFLGGSGGDDIRDVTVDSTGSIIVVGVTNSSNFPLANTPYDTSYAAYEKDIFVSKFSSNLQTLLASTFLGGTGKDIGEAIALDTSNNVYVTGYTVSGDFPTTAGVYDSTPNGWEEAFVTKLSSNLQTVLASTYLASSGFATDKANDVAINSSGDVYIVGYTDSSEFPIVGATYDSSFAGLDDGFISKLTSNLQTLLASTYIGGSNAESLNSIAFDGAGNVFVTGYTHSQNFPITPSVYDTTFNSNPSTYEDGFVSKFSSDLKILQASTYIGGKGADIVEGIEIGPSGNVYIAGWTQSVNFPTVGAYDSSLNGQQDGFITKLSSNLQNVLASTYLGGCETETLGDLAIDGNENIYVVGGTGGVVCTSDFPTKNAYDTTFNGVEDIFITKLSSNLQSNLASTYIGGSLNDRAYSIVLNSIGKAYVAGLTQSSDFPVSPNAYQKNYGGNGDWDGFVIAFGTPTQPISKPLPLSTKKTQFKQGEIAPFSVSTKLPGTFNSRLVDLAQAKEITLNPIAVKTEGDNITSVLYSFANIPANTYVLRLSKLSGDTIAESAPLTISVVSSNPLPPVFLLSTQTPSVSQGQTITINVYPGNLINHKLENGVYQLQWIDHEGQRLSISPLSTPSKSFSLLLPYTYSTASLSSGVYTVQLVDMSLPKKILASKQVTIVDHDLPTSDPTKPIDSPTSIPRSIPTGSVRK